MTTENTDNTSDNIDSESIDVDGPPVARVIDDENDEPDATPDELGQLREELEQARQQILRGHAELENYRKRSRRDTQDQIKFATVPMMRELVDVLDNLTRALEAGDSSDNEGLTHGVQLVADQLVSVLENHGCKKIESVGKPFDPNLHEAIQMMQSEEFDAGTVIQEVQTGYQVHERVVRPAKVIVAAEPQ